MAALVLLIPVVAVTAKIDRSQNKSGYQYDQVNYLKVRHGITPFALVSIRGEKPSAIFFLPAGSLLDSKNSYILLALWTSFVNLWFYTLHFPQCINR